MRILTQGIRMINRSTNKLSCLMVLLCALLGTQSALAAPADDFVTTWKTDNPGTSNATSIMVPMIGGPYDVDWDNDGTFDEFGLTGSIWHNFGAAGTYAIRIQGTYDSIQFNDAGDKQKILSLDQWGTNPWTSMNAAFFGARYLTIPAIDNPDFSQVTDMRNMFVNATSADPDTSGWDTSSVTSMRSMFYGASSADPDTSSWDTSAVTTMRTMFYSATSADPDTSGWNTELVTNMRAMFALASSANPNTSSWNTAAVTTMSSMFARAVLANPDTSGWDTAKVTDMTYMFNYAFAFNRAIGGWDVSSLADATSMFEGATLSSANYDNLLIGWDAQALKPGVSFHGGNSVYCSAAAILARSNLEGSNAWSITDGGQLCPVTPAAPIIAPDLIPETDTGVSNSDDLTTDSTPRFYVTCSGAGNTITLFTDNPVSNLPVGSHLCKSAGLEIANVNKALTLGLHNISYTDRFVRQESGYSPILEITLDPPLPTDDFVTTWKTDEPGSSNSSSIEFHLDGDPYDIDWNNDGIFDELGVSGSVIHDFGVSGIYTIRIRSGHASFHIGYDHESEKIISIDQWGTMLWTSLHTAFYNAKNLEIPAVDVPDFSAVTSTLQMFLGAILANPDTSMWDTSKVTGMQHMFWGARSAIPDTSNWDTSAVTDMSSMFWGATLANPDTSGWDTSSVTDMSAMFGSPNSFNQDIGSWNVTALTSAAGMFNGIALSTANYESLLIGWNAQALKSNVIFSGGNSVYCSLTAIAARANLIATYNWTITDGGQACIPADPSIAPDLTPGSDTGMSDSDDITTNITPAFFVMCSIAGNTISLYTDNPSAHTLVGSRVCLASGAEAVFVTTNLVVGLHNISYTDKISSAESGPSPSLAITIEPQGLADDFVTTWKTDNPGSSTATSITVPMRGGPYDVDWDNDGNFDETGLNGYVTHDFGGIGTYTIRIRGIYDAISFHSAGDKEKILSLDQWGTNTWKSMNTAFFKATNLVVPATDTPNFSSVTIMSHMFYMAASANPDTSSWDTSAVTSMSQMFNYATSASPDASGWDTSSVTDMSSMFWGATLANPDISGWDTSSVIYMSNMFYRATAFDQDIGSWNVTSLRYASNMFDGTALSPDNYDNLLIGWNAQALQPNVRFSGGNSNYCSAAAVTARANMITNDSWDITDSGLACPPSDPVVAPDLNPASDNGVSDSDDITTNVTPSFFVMCSIAGNTISLYTDNPTASTLVGTYICTAPGTVLVFITTPLVVGRHNISYTDKISSAESGPSPSLAITIEPLGPADDFVTTWKTDNPGSSTATSIRVPMQGGPYDVDWDNDGNFDELGLSWSVTHDFGGIGTYTIRIRGRYDGIGINDSGDREKILSLDQWGTNVWKSMYNAFAGASNLTVTATDTPNFSSVTRMDQIFFRAFSANPDTRGWDTSAVTGMRSMFFGATLANPDTSGWNTAAVTDMLELFRDAPSANPDTSDWDTSSVIDMGRMFFGATLAKPDTSGWDTSSVTNMSTMFDGATSANPDTSDWDTSSVIGMDNMFRGATLANPDVSGWDTSLVTEMRFMFYLATSFDQDISLWDVTSLKYASYMFAGAALSTANYDSLLIGWNAQSLKNNVTFSGGYSKYCSAAAIAARANLITTYNWTITDGGQGCPAVPAAPTTPPDLTPATDTGVSSSDNLTANSSPEFEVACSATGNAITLYTNTPIVNTAIGIHTCATFGTEIAATTAVLVDGVHNITYIDQYIGERSGHSPLLVVTIDTTAPAGPGSLTAPGSPINDINADIIGSCGVDAANDTVIVITSAAGGFTTLYNTPITLDGNGSFSIVDPNWSEGMFTVHFECSDVAGNTATLGPFGPILIDLSCSGVDTVVTGDFPAGMHLCAGTNSLVTSGSVNIEAGAVVYFQSPNTTLNNGFNVSEGASLISSTVVGPVAPLLLGPAEITLSVGEILLFSDSHICEDYEDGVLAITPFDTGVLVESAEPEVFTLSCTDFSGMTTEKNVTVIKH